MNEESNEEICIKVHELKTEMCLYVAFVSFKHFTMSLMTLNVIKFNV